MFWWVWDTWALCVSCSSCVFKCVFVCVCRWTLMAVWWAVISWAVSNWRRCCQECLSSGWVSTTERSLLSPAVRIHSFAQYKLFYLMAFVAIRCYVMCFVFFGVSQETKGKVSPWRTWSFISASVCPASRATEPFPSFHLTENRSSCLTVSTHM